ncbi:MAG TPA: hypothetical protein DDW27_13860, partial [Bacteroidales bacterium]|nr:hypothetical protein [Bacteroidales bacterium]
GRSLLDILRSGGLNIYAPCGGKGKCGKCMVTITGEGNLMSCSYYPEKDIEVVLPGKDIGNILVSQTEFLENVPFKPRDLYLTDSPYGIAVDIGTTTVVIYFLNLLEGRIEKIASFLNPQNIYGADVISRITYCQEHESGLKELQNVIINAINIDLDRFCLLKDIRPGNIENVVIAGNTTMLHLLLGEDPLSIALAPFKPRFTAKQIRHGNRTGLNVNPRADVITLPCISAYVGADIVAGLAVIKPLYENYLFLDIGTNGEMALVKGDKIFACATAAGPAFEGASLSCGTGAVAGAVSSFTAVGKYTVIGNTEPSGICGSGIVDIVAFLINAGLVEKTGVLKSPFVVHHKKNIKVTQEDIREIQLAKSAIYSGIRVLLKSSGTEFADIDALYLAGGFGNYININSAIKIGLLPHELEGRIYPVGNSAGIGALQYLKSDEFWEKITRVMANSEYIELSDSDDFTTEFVMNMDFG